MEHTLTPDKKFLIILGLLAAIDVGGLYTIENIIFNNGHK